MSRKDVLLRRTNIKKKKKKLVLKSIAKSFNQKSVWQSLQMISYHWTIWNPSPAPISSRVVVNSPMKSWSPVTLWSNTSTYKITKVSKMKQKINWPFELQTCFCFSNQLTLSQMSYSLALMLTTETRGFPVVKLGCTRLPVKVYTTTTKH